MKYDVKFNGVEEDGIFILDGVRYALSFILARDGWMPFRYWECDMRSGSFVWLSARECWIDAHSNQEFGAAVYTLLSAWNELTELHGLNPAKRLLYIPVHPNDIESWRALKAQGSGCQEYGRF